MSIIQSSSSFSTDSEPPEIHEDEAPAQAPNAYPGNTSLPDETNNHPEQQNPGCRTGSKHENCNQRKQQNVETRTGYNVGDDNGVVIIECSDDQEDIHDIANQTGDNIGNRNGVIEIRNGNQKEIYGIENKTGNNVGNNNGAVKIGNFGSA